MVCERRVTIRRNRRRENVEDGNANIEETRAIGRKFFRISEEIDFCQYKHT